jgi:hypothetical protein
MNKDHIVVKLEEQVFIYNLVSLALIKSLPCFKGGCISLCIGGTSYLAIPHQTAAGLIQVYNCGNDDIKPLFPTPIAAHKSKIALCHISPSGGYLASASITGTIIRLFSLPSGDFCASYRRGFHHALVTSISFCIMDTFLAVGSSSGTIHVFIVDSMAQSTLKPVDTSKVSDPAIYSDNPPANIIPPLSDNKTPMTPVRLLQTVLGNFSSNVVMIATEVARQSKELREAMDPLRAEFIIRIPGGETQFKAIIQQENYRDSCPKIFIVTDGGFLYRLVNR